MFDYELDLYIRTKKRGFSKEKPFSNPELYFDEIDKLSLWSIHELTIRI